MHFHFRRVPRLREIRRQLSSLHEDFFVQLFLFSRIAHDYVRTTVLRHMKPEVIRCRHVEGEIIVLPAAPANQDFPVVNFQCANPPRPITHFRRGVSAGLLPGRQLARNCQPRIPILDGLEPAHLILHNAPAISRLRNLLRDDFFSSSCLLVPLEHSVDVFPQAYRRIQRHIDLPGRLGEIVRHPHRLIVLFHLHSAGRQHLRRFLQALRVLIFLLLSQQPFLAVRDLFADVAEVPQHRSLRLFQQGSRFQFVVVELRGVENIRKKARAVGPLERLQLDRTQNRFFQPPQVVLLQDVSQRQIRVEPRRARGRTCLLEKGTNFLNRRPIAFPITI